MSHSRSFDLADTTFSSFTKSEGANYADNRPDYHPKLYKTIIEHHTSTGGQLDTILDIGCGPGTTARALAPHFAHARGLDPSEGMIQQAQLLGGTSSTSELIKFDISTAETLGSNLSPPIADASVDLITASTAAHWFDMARFWLQAARVLKPGGTVAIWAVGSIKIHPTVPNANAIQEVLDDLEKNLEPFHQPGSLIVRDLYQNLALPWTLDMPMSEFDGTTFFRKEWGPEESDEFFVGGGLTVNPDAMEKMLGTTSPVQRWRKAHPNDAGTERDIVRVMRRETERLSHEAGVDKGKETIKGSLKGVLLMVKTHA